MPKNWSFQIVVLEKTLESPLDSKEIKPVNPKGNQDAAAPILWLPNAKSWLIEKDPDAGKDSDAGRDWGQEEKGTTEDEMAGWHHRVDGRESEWTPGVGDGQGGLVAKSRTWLSDWTELILKEKDTKKIILYNAKDRPRSKKIYQNWLE